MKSYFVKILLMAKECDSGKHCKSWNNIANLLWNSLQKKFSKIDDQLLCSICFYTIASYTDDCDRYINGIQKILEFEIENLKPGNLKISQCNIALMYGLFQSNFLTSQCAGDIINFTRVLQLTFDLLIIMGYEYTQFTFLAFKIMKSFKKVCNTKWQTTIFKRDNQIKLMNVINHNWENPITGVRDLLKSIFNTLLTTLDDVLYLLTLKEINQFYWNKAKYLMLCEVIHVDCKNILVLMSENDWAQGLFSSLNIPSLVSAGADMYFAILKRIKCVAEWCNIFLNSTISLFQEGTEKSIQNFSNYWCLTTLKRFPSLLGVFIEKIMKNNFKQEPYALMCIIKQGNKLGIFEKDWNLYSGSNNIMNTVEMALEHKIAPLRIDAFDIVCVSHSKSLPIQREYTHVLEYLKNNMNSDCTVLRLNMMRSLKSFLNQLHVSYLNYMKTYKNCDVIDLICFCKSLQEIVFESLELNGNYQRKITAVKLTYLIMECFNEVPRKKKKQIRQTNTSLLHYLKTENQWFLGGEKMTEILIKLLKDPSDDVRENVVQLLLKYYLNEIQNANFLNNLATEALSCIRSKFFFVSNCGQSMLKLLSNLLLIPRNIETKYQSIEEIFNYAYNELLSEYKKDIMTSIENETQLYSFINILIVVLEVCIDNSFNIRLSTDTIHELIRVLQYTTNQFTWEQDNCTSSDFAKMSEVVEGMIAQSENSAYNENDEVKISGIHQIVLNCLWLNVKASCDLASLLVQFNKDDFETCRKCLELITHVLESSRHKGAIEAAGAALGKVIQCLTSLPEESNILNSMNSFLESKLNELISKVYNMASITRRGAGLPIMVHRIVSSDMNKGKPLFHYFLKNILELCNSVLDVPKLEDNASVLENEMDLPKAIYIHFLTKVVTDSSLACDVMYYSSELSELAFLNLTSEHWQIRNAALQLYGALIPRQIGQKKALGTDDNTIATVAWDELRTHSPRLWKMITTRLRIESQSIQIVSHSNLVPILNLLASCAKRYNLSFDCESQVDELLTSLILLLGSPIYIVRRLSAKCISNNFKFEEIGLLSYGKFNSENFIHGTLMLLKHYTEESLNMDTFDKTKSYIENILTNKVHSYLCKQYFEDIFCNKPLALNDIEDTFFVLENKMYEPGVFLWADARLQKYLRTCPWFEIPNLLKMFFNHEGYDRCLKYLLLKMKRDMIISEPILLEITNTLLEFNKKYESSYIWKIIFEVSLRTDLTKSFEIISFLNNSVDLVFSYKLRYIVPLAAKVLECLEENVQLHFSKIIWQLSDPKMDVNMRHIAALANNKVAEVFKKLPKIVKINSLKSAIILLQDEDVDVRNLSVIFYKNISQESAEKQCYICLKRIMQKEFLESLFCEPNEIEMLFNDLSEVLQNLNNKQKDEFNPFANELKNIYLEVDVLQQLLESLKNSD
ncbi:uncharacterized protein LOC101745429 isoform X2 [Bombyx mori]|uniref:DUF2428 domain-containing protein n=1 Tax=Bombyx mori TaxID=7091 RepID=A0A8R2M5G9_BOMMO|nr:tRNA (cytidine(32)-2'-O)-methyltransferase non-catalytic subunit TRM732 isoform X2 [Bombyx mori]